MHGLVPEGNSYLKKKAISVCAGEPVCVYVCMCVCVCVRERETERVLTCKQSLESRSLAESNQAPADACSRGLLLSSPQA